MTLFFSVIPNHPQTSEESKSLDSRHCCKGDRRRYPYNCDRSVVGISLTLPILAACRISRTSFALAGCCTDYCSINKTNQRLGMRCCSTITFSAR